MLRRPLARPHRKTSEAVVPLGVNTQDGELELATDDGGLERLVDWDAGLVQSQVGRHSAVELEEHILALVKV